MSKESTTRLDSDRCRVVGGYFKVDGTLRTRYDPTFLHAYERWTWEMAATDTWHEADGPATRYAVANPRCIAKRHRRFRATGAAGGRECAKADGGEMRYRKKPVVIEAVRWDGKLTTIEPLLADTTTPCVAQDIDSSRLLIPTLEGEMRAEVGDYIIRGIKGELYPCKPDLFEATYEAVE